MSISVILIDTNRLLSLWNIARCEMFLSLLDSDNHWYLSISVDTGKQWHFAMFENNSIFYQYFH